MSKKIEVIVKKPGMGFYVDHIDNTLETLQEIVGGYIETFTIAKDAVIVCNEEGKLMGLPHNIDIRGESFVGNIIFAGIKGDEFTDIPLGNIDFVDVLFRRKEKATAANSD